MFINYLVGFVKIIISAEFHWALRGSPRLLQVTHQIPAPLSVISTPLQSVGRPLLGTGVRKRLGGQISSPVSFRSGRIYSAVPLPHVIGPSVCLQLAVRGQRVVLLWTVARRPTVVAVAAFSPRAAFGWGVAVLVHPGGASPRPGLALQGAVEERIVVSPAVLGTAGGSVAVPCVPPLLHERRGAAAAPVVVLVPVGPPGRAVVPLIGPVSLVCSPASGAVGTCKVLQLVQGACAPPSAQRLPLQVLRAAVPPANT